MREHLGILIDLRKNQFSVSSTKLRTLQGKAILLAQQAATNKRWVSKLDLASFAGYVISLSVALPVARFHLLPIYDAINSAPGWGPFQKVRLSSGAYRKLKYYFSSIPPEDIGCFITP